MKSITIQTESGPVHADVADEATEADVERITEYVRGLRAERAQMERDFEQLWEAQGGRAGEGLKEVARHWFGLGYELRGQRGRGAK